MTDAVTTKWGDTALNVYILYDRSQSMMTREEEAVPGMNAYVRELAPDTVVTVVAFDGHEPRQIVRDHVRAKTFTPISVDEVKARGMTPLFDATGWMIDKIFQDNPFRAVLVVQTDGDENYSREFKFSDITRRMGDMQRRNWPVVFLGAEFKDVGRQSVSLGVGLGNTVNRGKGYYGATASMMAAKTMNYASTGFATSGTSDWFTAADKATLGDKDTVAPATPVDKSV